LTSVIKNALKFVDQSESMITIKVAHDSDTDTLQVKIAFNWTETNNSERDKLFQTFGNLEEVSTDNNTKNICIDLVICKDIVLQSGGTIEYHV